MSYQMHHPTHNQPQFSLEQWGLSKSNHIKLRSEQQACLLEWNFYPCITNENHDLSQIQDHFTSKTLFHHNQTTNILPHKAYNKQQVKSRERKTNEKHTKKEQIKPPLIRNENVENVRENFGKHCMQCHILICVSFFLLWPKMSFSKLKLCLHWLAVCGALWSGSRGKERRKWVDCKTKATRFAVKPYAICVHESRGKNYDTNGYCFLYVCDMFIFLLFKSFNYTSTCHKIISTKMLPSFHMSMKNKKELTKEKKNTHNCSIFFYHFWHTLCLFGLMQLAGSKEVYGFVALLNLKKSTKPI